MVLCELREQLFSHLRGYVYYYHNYRRKIIKKHEEKLNKKPSKILLEVKETAFNMLFLFLLLLNYYILCFYFLWNRTCRIWERRKNCESSSLWICKNFLRKRVFLESKSLLHDIFEDTNETKNSSIHKNKTTNHVPRQSLDYLNAFQEDFLQIKH